MPLHICNYKNKAHNGSVQSAINQCHLTNWQLTSECDIYYCKQPDDLTRTNIIYRYVKDILSKTSKSLEVVTIEPNGRWSTKPSEQERSQSNQTASFDNDDAIEISELTVVGDKRLDTPKNSTPVHSLGTPASASSSIAPRGAGSTSSKRPAPQVIDLTLSSDEDDEPVQRPTKRQNTSTNGFRDSNSRLGFFSESPLALPR